MQLGLGISPTRSMAPAAPAFTPASISGLQLWLDASDASTLFTDSAGTTAVTADGDPVGCWSDKSGNNNHVVQSDPTLKPSLRTNIQNGKNVVRGDGVNDYIASSTGGADSSFTLFCVTISRLDGTAFSPFSVGELALRKARILNKTSGNNIQFSTTGSSLYDCIVNSALSWLSGTPIIAQMKNNAGLISLAKNNGTFSTGVAPINFYGQGLLAYSSGVIRVMRGNTASYNGDICELLYYTAALSDADKAGIVAYLNAKWSVY